MTQDGTIITWDHHEDGYEADINAPVQSTTQVWGDGDLTNGIAPGTTNDLVNAGDVIVVQNTVPIGGFPGTLYDGGDYLVSDQLIAVTRAGWSPYPGTVLAGTVEMTDLSRWGTDYVLPIGEDTPGVFNQFEYTGLYIMAQADGTTVDIDTNGDGTWTSQPRLAAANRSMWTEAFCKEPPLRPALTCRSI